MVSDRMKAHMDRWALRTVPGWAPGKSITDLDQNVTCCECAKTWYERDVYTARFQPSGLYRCFRCRPTSREMVALCQSIPYEVLSIFLAHRPPERVTARVWK